MLLLSNALVCQDDFSIKRTDVLTSDGRIVCIGDEAGRNYLEMQDHDKECLDLDGFLLLPGLIDIHIHGCDGFDTCDADLKALSGMSAYLARQGVTSFLATTMTMSMEQIDRSVDAVGRFMSTEAIGANALGIHLEGPYLSRKYAGIQRAEYLREPLISEINDLENRYPGLIRLIDVAPELAGADDFIKEASKKWTLSIAHTDADYDLASKSFSRGISHATHIFNAMSGLSHRSPGTVGAVLDHESVTAELICDGYHIHPAVLRIAFRLLGEDRSIIVSDAMRAAGCGDGTYDLGGQTVEVRKGRTFQKNGGPAGSVTNILEEMKNLLSYGVPLRQIIKSATINPARVIGMDHEIGSISTGKRADLIVVDADLNLFVTIINGRIFRRSI